MAFSKMTISVLALTVGAGVARAHERRDRRGGIHVDCSGGREPGWPRPARWQRLGVSDFMAFHEMLRSAGFRDAAIKELNVVYRTPFGRRTT